ncbi:carbohydrate ABC transporter substrate-binding protein, CUT1 family [Nakamurella panacisegetis]|uniref:Carbohydrate ABC transporter substrate-binding protein, CUT1 family n=1 Tax=Nakamurella panacisegetis TaxID=1090615 RepID=A0A1H0N581_9ACTN|nr:extracellular solute-binding protein [Nakamurella panacisegetis]SDO87828.1 carbohydrate ABC transporter substrate-binding protein, CUT1 family [Nakamurella panacisegetis]
MRRSRPIFTAVAVLAGASLLLTGCGSKSSSSGSGGGGSLDVFISAQPNYPDQFAAWSKEITAKFKAATGADLTIETYASSSDETTKIQASIVSGTGPDVYQLGTTFTPVAYATKGFTTLTDADWAKIGGRARYYPESLAMSGPDAAHQIGIPVAMRPYAMVYNTDMFKAAGITTPPATWDDLIKVATKLTKNGVYGLAMDYADGFDPWKYIWTLSEQSGGSFVSKDLKTAQLTSPKVVAATATYFDFVTKYKVTDTKSVGWKNADAVTAFGSGKAAMIVMSGPGAIPSLDKSSVNGKYAFAPLPDVPVGMTTRPAGASAAQSIVSGDNVAIASYSKNKDLALAYVNLLTGNEMQTAQFNYFGFLPTNKDAFAALAAKNSTLAPFAAAEKGSTPTAFTGAWSDVQNGVTNTVVQSLPSLVKGSYDTGAITALLTKANSAAQSSLDRANK